MANHELYVVQGKTLDNIAGTMRAVLGVDKDAPIRFDEVASSDKTEQINAEVETQADIIAQIKTALEGKAASGGGGTEEIENIIDQSGVLGTTDKTVTVTEKVEQLVDKAEVERFLVENSTSYNFNGNKNFTETPLLDCSGLTSLANAFQNTNVKKIYLENTQNVSNLQYAFYNASYLETLETLDFSSVKQLPNWISSDYLTNIKFVSNTIKVSMNLGWCKKLTAESIQSIIDGLADLTGGTAQTLTLNATVKEKLTETQLATITSKNWNLA